MFQVLFITTQFPQSSTFQAHEIPPNVHTVIGSFPTRDEAIIAAERANASTTGIRLTDAVCLFN
jgi:hypothetical protein